MRDFARVWLLSEGDWDSLREEKRTKQMKRGQTTEKPTCFWASTEVNHSYGSLSDPVWQKID